MGAALLDDPLPGPSPADVRDIRRRGGPAMGVSSEQALSQLALTFQGVAPPDHVDVHVDEGHGVPATLEHRVRTQGFDPGGVRTREAFHVLHVVYFTIKESRIFCAILPEELLATEWMKKTGSLAVNVRAMATLSTDLTHLVADSIPLPPIQFSILFNPTIGHAPFFNNHTIATALILHLFTFANCSTRETITSFCSPENHLTVFLS
ncbi:ras guanine-nucleotide exchange protein [Aspergillus niger]|uniref:Ras guanine-nucleotide exchange protein n=1 Tax=Aspergillus niger TaxID=5061 RepID=A0A100ILU8_ASPNG|nr:ras guanine-nucleotide exchange protein [Aspergillus niger]